MESKNLGGGRVLEAIFAHLSPEHRRKLEEMALEIPLRKGELLFSPGNPSRGFYVVRGGAW